MSILGAIARAVKKYVSSSKSSSSSSSSSSKSSSSSSSKNSSSSSSKNSSSSSPSYGQDSKGYYKTTSSGSKVYANSSNAKYFPSNYGGTANWKYNGSSNSSGSSTYSSSSPSYGQDSSGYYKTSTNGTKTYLNSGNAKYFPSNYGGTANWKYTSSTPSTSNSISNSTSASRSYYSAPRATNTYTNTGGYNNSGSTSYTANHQNNSTSGYATTSPTYGKDTKGTYKQTGTNRTYMTSANAKYFPSNYGGTANWMYTPNTTNNATSGKNVNPAVASSNNAFKGSVQGESPTSTSTNGYDASFLANEYGKIANDYSYEGVKKKQEILNQMKGQDESLYANDEYAHRMWQIANGQTVFGNSANNPYYAIQFASDDKTDGKYYHGISEADNVAQHLWSLVGEDKIEDYYNMNASQLSDALTSLGLKTITPEQLRSATYYDMNHATSGLMQTMHPHSFQDQYAAELGAKTGGTPILDQVMQKYYITDSNGNTKLRDGLVLVNGTPMQWSDYVKYGGGEDDQTALYKNILQNEKTYGYTEQIPLKARAALAPETMTDEMKSDLQTQTNLENQIKQIDEQLASMDREISYRRGTPEWIAAHPEAADDYPWLFGNQTAQVQQTVPQYSNDLLYANGGAANVNYSDYSQGSNESLNELSSGSSNGSSGSVYSALASEPNLGGGSGTLNNGFSDMSQYLQGTSYGKASTSGEGVGNLTSAQIAQLNAMRKAVAKRNGVM